MTKGGYQIIDLNNHPYTLEQGVVVDGIYEKIEGTRKAILISGIFVDGIEFHDTFVTPFVDGANYVAVIGVNPAQNRQYIIEIQDNDVVEFRAETAPN